MDATALLARLPAVRGHYTPLAPLAPLTWFRVGGAAEVLFRPADVADLAAFLAGTPPDVPVTVIGVGSNLLVRDGGVRGVVVRLGAAFAQISTEGAEVIAGAAALDARVAELAADAGIDGLSFLRGVPGALGGALRMNAGCYGTEIKDVFVSATALDRMGQRHVLSREQMGFAYRHSAPEGLIFVSARLRGRAGDPASIRAHMATLMAGREASQPIREKTGGSTFRNPAGFSSTGQAGDSMELKAWKLIDAAGCRGLRVGGAQVSEKHCNFLINTGTATAADLETLGNIVISRVREHSGHVLDWEIKRIGEPA